MNIKKILIISFLTILSITFMSCTKELQYVSFSTYDAYKSYQSSDEENCKKYGSDGIIYSIALNADGNYKLKGTVLSSKKLDYVKIKDVTIEIPDIQYSYTQQLNVELDKNTNFKKTDFFEEKYWTYDDSSKFIVNCIDLEGDQVKKKLNKPGAYPVDVTINYEAKCDEKIYTFTDELIKSEITVTYGLSKNEWYWIWYTDLIIAAVLLCLILIFHKKEKKGWIYILLALFYGEFGLHNIYAKEYKKLIGKYLCLLFIIPLTLLFVSAIGHVIEEPMSDPTYGIILLSFLGLTIPCTVVFVLNIIDIIKYFVNSNNNKDKEE